MRTGLYPMSVIAFYLGKRDAEMKSLVELDGFPAINIPAKTKPILKGALTPFHQWLAKRSQNTALTLEELAAELELAAEALTARRTKKEEAAA